jgi:hypothetical protein
MSWEPLIAALVLVNAICIFLDRYLLNRHKTRIYELLLRLWDRIDETRIIELHRLVASQTAHLLKAFAFPKNHRYRGIIKTALLSAALTCVAFLIGYMLLPDNYFYKNDLSIVIPLAIPVNLIFDVSTIVATFFILNSVARKPLRLSLVLMATDVVIAYALACLCLTSLTLIYSLIELPFVPVDMLKELTILNHYYIIDSLRFLMGLPDAHGPPIMLPYALFACTTLIPTFLYLLMLVFLILAKPLLSAGKTSIMYFIERATEIDNPKALIVFSLFGAALSVIALLLKFVATIV